MLATTLEYLATEIFETSSTKAREGGFKRIKPRHIVLAVAEDPALNEIMQKPVLRQGGVVPTLP
jgi:histone H2A